MSDNCASTPSSLGAPPAGGKLLRRSNSDRLRMRAPSSIQVSTPKTSCAAGWKIAIPLLSPLDPAVDMGQHQQQQQQEEEENVLAVDEVVAVGESRRRSSTWKHPAAPFYYEPMPTNVTPFLLPA